MLVDDDVATESDDGPGRRGTAAVIAVEKICGAAAARGASLAGGRRARPSRRRRRPLDGDRAARAHAPRADAARRSTSAPSEIELGVGIHGERGVGRRSHAPASELAEALLGPIARGARPAERRARAADRERPRRDARPRAQRHVRRGRTPARRARGRGRALARRPLRDVARHVGLLAHAWCASTTSSSSSGTRRCARRR